MKLSRRTILSGALCLCAAFVLAACAPAENTNNNSTTSATPSASATPAVQTLTETGRPAKIQDMMRERGEQDSAAPVLKIVEPRDGATIDGSTVSVRLNLSGDLKGYQPHKDPATNMGNHIHVILDNQPYEAYYELGQPFELRNVSEGPHTLRVFPSRPWHESYKNDGAFQMVSFNVRGGGDGARPTTTNTGEKMADGRNSNTNSSNANAAANTAANANANASTSATPAATPEGKEMQQSNAGAVDKTKPLLTYSRPKGEYKGDDTNAIMIDFWLSNARLQADGGEYRVRYSVDGGEPKYIETWSPIWLSGWTPGKHTVKLELVDRIGNVIENGGYNSTSRDITITK